MEDRDYKQRTPLQVAAELGMVIYWIKTEKFLNVCVILLNCSCHSTYNYFSVFDCFIIYPEVLIRTKLAAGGISRASAFVCFWYRSHEREWRSCERTGEESGISLTALPLANSLTGFATRE